MKSFLIPFFSLCISSVCSQDSLSVKLKWQLVKDWQRAKAYSLEYLNAMPADKYDFRPVDGVRNFAEQMLHFAKSNAGMAFIGTGFSPGASQVFRSPNFGESPLLHNKDSVHYYVTSSYDIMIDAIKNTDLAKLTEVVSWRLPGGMRSTTRLGWLMKAFEHQTHHRGQCTVYFRLVGISPPNERLWDD
jgi:hypothetical protein